ncbi:hypothetical protein [Nocardia cyriacigeorgica]|uniref:hypothetical protein n=2 Tax=Nocardia cyriacigeorgica TaxID=135487 RepID=UPI0024542607|nr:hypothetical protein [Nocardia cyriacigeorgica]
MNESAAARVRRGWARARETRYRIAAGLGLAGSLVWAGQAFGAWMQSQEGKWQGNEYMSVGGWELTADNLLTLLSLAALVVAGLLGWGAVGLLRGRASGRTALLAGAWLVALGQLIAAVLAWLPIDAFYYSAPANLVFATPLVVFPLLTILLCSSDGKRYADDIEASG